MAEERVDEKRRPKARRRRAAADGGEPLSGGQLAQEAKRQLSEITGMEAANVTSMDRSDEDGWKLDVELVELSRVPRAADVLGLYEVRLDAAGTLLGYRRLRRYSRGETGGSDNG